MKLAVVIPEAPAMTPFNGKIIYIKGINAIGIYRQSSVKILPIKNTSSYNILHIFHPFFTLPTITVAIVKIKQKSTVHLKIN